MGGLVEAGGEDLAQLARRIGEAVEHLDEERTRNAQHGRGLERSCGGGTPGVGEQRDLAQQRIGPDRYLAVLFRRQQREGAFLDHEGAFGLVARIEQHFAIVDVTGLRADRQNAQGLAAEQTERRHPFEETDVVLDGHGTMSVRARACSRLLRSPGSRDWQRPSRPSAATDKYASRACAW